MENNKKDTLLPTTTTTFNRFPIFQPTIKANLLDGVSFTSEQGTVHITGRLGQRHQDIFESLFYIQEQNIECNDGKVFLLVDPYKLRKFMGEEKKSLFSFGQLKKLLAELRACTIRIENASTLTTTETIIGGLLNSVTPSKVKVRNPLTREERNLWKVELGTFAILIFKRDNYSYVQDPRPFMSLESGIAKAVARFIYSSKDHLPNGGWKLDTVIEQVYGRKITGHMLWNARRYLRKDAENLKKIGIILFTNEKKQERITYQDPKTLPEPQEKSFNSFGQEVVIAPNDILESLGKPFEMVANGKEAAEPQRPLPLLENQPYKLSEAESKLHSKTSKSKKAVKKSEENIIRNPLF